MKDELDLQRSIRPGLDILANEIVIALTKRSKYPLNGPIYEPGLVRGSAGISLLRYELARVEQIHAELGRFTFANQESFTDVSAIESIIERHTPESPIHDFPSGLGDMVIDWYLKLLPRFCDPGDHPDTYGETVTADVAALLTVYERVMLGKFAAESKYQEQPAAFHAAAGDETALKTLIVKPDREKDVLNVTTELAQRYEFDEAVAREVFVWMIARTIELEVDYLRSRVAAGA